MAVLDDIKAKLASIPAVIDAIAADQGGLIAEIADLKAQIAAGNPVTAADLDELLASATAIKDRLDAVDASVPVP